MRKSNHHHARELLRAHPDGLTTKQLSALAGVKASALHRALLGMPDAYIDRWEGPYRGQYAAVWCVVVPPPHCPRPDA